MEEHGRIIVSAPVPSQSLSCLLLNLDLCLGTKIWVLRLKLGLDNKGFVSLTVVIFSLSGVQPLT